MKYQIIKTARFNQNCIIVSCNKTHEAALIDPGSDSDSINDKVINSKLIIKKILLTHGHLDHVGAASTLAKKYQAPILGPHLEDKWLIKNLHIQCKIFSINYIPPVTVNNWLSDGNIINIGHENLSVLHCPGHSPGHLAFYSISNKLIFTGDILFKGAIGRTDLPGGNLNTLLSSIKNKIIPLGMDNTFIPGHGPISTIQYENKHNPFLIKMRLVNKQYHKN